MQLSNEQVDTLLARIDREAKSSGAAVYGLPLIEGRTRESLRSIVSGWIGELSPPATQESEMPLQHAHVWESDDGSAICKCGAQATGWFCADSPTRICVYTNSWDECDHCGQPEERK